MTIEQEDAIVHPLYSDSFFTIQHLVASVRMGDPRSSILVSSVTLISWSSSLKLLTTRENFPVARPTLIISVIFGLNYEAYPLRPIDAQELGFFIFKQNITNCHDCFFTEIATVLQWSSAFLTDCTPYASLCNHCFFPFAPVRSGVPHWSFLGPVLFTMHIKPLSTIIGSLSITRHSSTYGLHLMTTRQLMLVT